MTDINPDHAADWRIYDMDLVDGDNLQKRYPQWHPIAAINQDRSYEFDIVAVFYDPLGDCYYAARTSGCSCPSPWDENQTEVKGPLFTPRDAIRAFRDLAKDADSYTDHYKASETIDAVGAILNHNKEF